VLALLATALTGTSANAGAWCANYLRGVSNCGYSSAAQCWATVRGLGDGFCAPNPYPGTVRVGRQLEYSQLETLSAQLLGPRTHKSSFVSAACSRKRPKQVVISRRRATGEPRSGRSLRSRQLS